MTHYWFQRPIALGTPALPIVVNRQDDNIEFNRGGRIYLGGVTD